MIISLRRHHRTIVVAAAIIAPLIFFTALASRVPVVQDNSLHRLRNNPAADAVLLGEQALTLDRAAVRISLLQAPTTRQLVISPVNNRQTAGADVLVYWQRTSNPDTLAPNAHLLGPLLQQRMTTLALDESKSDGQVVFYSLAQQRVIQTITLDELIQEH